ncbi:GntR family transcriptional regulator ['Osedax' symbiont bacterium Rs2_46_30_T18]|nr:GntR family transcriptional regulator ['Osedax' symbiont bacterium Rs2_46_30_T18]
MSNGFIVMGTIWEIDKQAFIEDCETQAKYKVLAGYIEAAISSGELAHQQKLPAQRWLADQLNVTHGTVTRAYALAEKRGIVVAKLGAGTFVNSGLLVRESNQCIDFSASMQPMLGQQNILAQAMHELANDSVALLQMMAYSAEGISRHKKVFSQWLSAKGIENNAKELIFTQGAQQGIYSVLQVLTQPGDLVVHEQLCYPGFHKAARASGLQTQEVPLTNQGLDLAILEDICRENKVKVLYITPNMQNPTNFQYSHQLLQKLLVLSKKYQFYIIEDDVNYCLSQYWRPPFQQQAPDRFIYLSSLSKYFAGGLRIGYMLAPRALQAKLNQHIHAQCWMVSTMNFELACRFIQSDSYLQNQQRLEAELGYRQQAFIEMFERYNLSVCCGGLNLWLELPDDINMYQLCGLLLAKNVKVRTADVFTAANSQLQSNALRIAIGGPDSRQLFDRGVVIFSQVLEQLNAQTDVVI